LAKEEADEMKHWQQINLLYEASAADATRRQETKAKAERKRKRELAIISSNVTAAVDDAPTPTSTEAAQLITSKVSGRVSQIPNRYKKII